MSGISFRQFQRQLTNHCDAKEYACAYELLLKEKSYFREYRLQMAYWHIRIAALIGRPAEALQVFQETVDQGYWFPLDRLKNDPYLTSMRETAAFQELVEVCQQRVARIQDTVQLEMHVIQPAQQIMMPPLLIALHGNGTNADITVGPWEGVTRSGWLLAVPRSTQFVGPGAYVWDDREKGCNEVREHLATLRSKYAVDPDRMVLGGFSMGGGQAIWMALHQLIKTRGFVVLGPYMREEELEALAEQLRVWKVKGVRGYIIVGEEDTECLSVSCQVVELMRAVGLPCEIEIKPGLAHVYPPDFVESLTKGLSFVEQN